MIENTTVFVQFVFVSFRDGPALTQTVCAVVIFKCLFGINFFYFLIISNTFIYQLFFECMLLLSCPAPSFTAVSGRLRSWFCSQLTCRPASPAPKKQHATSNRQPRSWRRKHSALPQCLDCCCKFCTTSKQMQTIACLRH